MIPRLRNCFARESHKFLVGGRKELRTEGSTIRHRRTSDNYVRRASQTQNTAALSTPPRQPNIVMVLVDDMRWDEMRFDLTVWVAIFGRLESTVWRW